MTQEYLLSDEHSFMEKLEEVVNARQPGDRITTYTPLPVHGIDDVLREPATLVRVYSMVGAIAGILTAFWLTVFTSQRFPIIEVVGQAAGLVVGGKPPISFLAYCVIAFELAVLFGSIGTLIGFLLLGRLPNIIHVLDPKDYGNQFAIVLERPDANDD
ncbi:MAG: DUF3341 domain-containing protein [Armatimonadetes bacterium]|nr:DUF3341 domain-containing protein [Armatimonadota bacterium]